MITKKKKIARALGVPLQFLGKGLLGVVILGVNQDVVGPVVISLMHLVLLAACGILLWATGEYLC